MEFIEIIGVVLAGLLALVTLFNRFNTSLTSHITGLFSGRFEKIDDQFNELRVANSSLSNKVEVGFSAHDRIESKIDCLVKTDNEIRDKIDQHDVRFRFAYLWAKAFYNSIKVDHPEIPDPDDYLKTWVDKAAHVDTDHQS